MLKSLLALFVNSMILAQFATADYVTWSVTSSVLAVATASDLGIGQYAVTRYIHTDRKLWPSIAWECLSALMPLALGAILFVFLFTSGTSLLYKGAMALFLGLRILTIPFGAVLNAVNQFKLRKGIEVGVYLLVLFVVYVLIYLGRDIDLALLVLNAAFLLGGMATVYAAKNYLPSGIWPKSLVSKSNMMKIYRNSAPFMVSNLTGLLTYGGFIWVSSFFLPQVALAQVSILHTFVLMNLYQIYDVFLKSRQADLVNATHIRRMQRINMMVMLGVPLAMGLAGGMVWRYLLPDLMVESSVLWLFGVFIALELGALFTQSLVQVNVGMVRWLTLYALLRLICQILALAFYSVYPMDSELGGYLGWIVVCSSIGYLITASHFHLQGREISIKKEIE